MVAESLMVPQTFIGRGIGLMFRSPIALDRGMWINPCNGIHMLCMRFAIDAVFLDGAQKVVKVYERVAPWYGVVWIVWRAHSVLELAAGRAREIGIEKGDEIRIDW